MADDDARDVSIGGIAVRASALAAIATIPSLAAFLVLWSLLDDLLAAAVAGGVTLFVIMGFSPKIARALNLS